MDLIFNNPTGFWALAAIPLFVLIHCFQRRSREVIIPTLFLWNSLLKDKDRGRRFTFWRSSPSFWLQCLCALLATWLLIAPRWLSTESEQRVAIIIDDSWSMDAFKEKRHGALQTLLERFDSIAKDTHWYLSTTNPAVPILYQGNDARGLLHVAATHNPTLGQHDPNDALTRARRTLGEDTFIIFLTDQAYENLPADISTLGIGSPTDNVGFVGVTIDTDEGRTIWRAMLRNYGHNSITSQWWMEGTQGEHSETRPFTLAPMALKTISGTLPEGIDRFTLKIPNDAFTLDNSLPVIRPKNKTLGLATATTNNAVNNLLVAANRATRAERTATSLEDTDLIIVPRQSLDTPNSPEPRIIFHADEATQKPLMKGLKTAEPHSLMAELNWQGLIAKKPTTPFTVNEDAQVLLWIDSYPAIFLNKRGNIHDLVFNLSASSSNLDRLPAFALLINRFSSNVRATKVQYSRDNVELGQALTLSLPTDTATVRLSHDSPHSTETTSFYGRAPMRPGFFTVLANETPIYSAAAHFSDPREADLTRAASFDNTQKPLQHQALANSRADPFTAIWILIFIGSFIASAWFSEKGL